MKITEQITNKRRTVHSISFKEEDRKIIELAAQQEGVSFASFLKNATLAYIRESLEYQRLVQSGELKETDKPIAEVISDFKDAIGSSIVAINENNSKRLRKIEWMIEKTMFILLFYNPILDCSDEERSARTEMSKIRVREILKGYKEE